MSRVAYGTGGTKGTLSYSMTTTGPAEAEALFREALEIREETLPPDHPLLAWTRSQLAGALIGVGRSDEARLLLERSWAILEPLAGGRWDDEIEATRGWMAEVH